MRTSAYWRAAALALLFWVALPAAAQTAFYLPEPTADTWLEASPFYIARVVDARPQHTSLGLVMRAGAPRLATFQAGIPATLLPFFTAHAPGRLQAVPLVMRLTGLEITEAPSGLGEVAVAGLVADFYAPQPDSSYQLVAHFAKVHERAGLDATGQHAANLGNLLLEAAQLATSPSGQLPAGLRYPRAAVCSPQPLAAEGLPILAPAERPRPGIYHSLPEFWHNQPSEAGPPDVERHPYTTTEWSGDYEVKPYHLNEHGRRVPAAEAWGFCDGTDFYLRRGRSFYKLQRRGQDFVYYGQIGDDPDFQRVAGGQAAAAGLVGGLLLASATTPSGSKRVLFTLQVLTGKSHLSQFNTATSAIVGRPTHLFVYRPRDAKGPAVRIRLAENQPAQELAAGDFLTFEPASEQPLRVCLLPATGPETYLAVTPTAEAPIYLECRPTEPEPLRRVKETAGAAALNKMIK